ncbi:hypothetical protein, partial [Paenirhodobacter populi]|uniref:hypothetical protein n=1 Tax=Paenirhodobacter populi TaxID=2306993 RepID=UPI0019D426C4
LQNIDFTDTAVATANGAMFIASANTLWTYPISFPAGAPMVWGSLSSSVENVQGVYLRNATTASCNIRPYSSVSRAAGVAKTAVVVAIGRWHA